MEHCSRSANPTVNFKQESRVKKNKTKHSEFTHFLRLKEFKLCVTDRQTDIWGVQLEGKSFKGTDPIGQGLHRHIFSFN